MKLDLNLLITAYINEKATTKILPYKSIVDDFIFHINYCQHDFILAFNFLGINLKTILGIASKSSSVNPPIATIVIKYIYPQTPAVTTSPTNIPKVTLKNEIT